jgi:SAM-dependent methyltransferase
MNIDEIREKFPEDVRYTDKNFILNWCPSLPNDRTKHYGLMNFLKEKFRDKRCLEIGYRWAGRFFHNARVLDLYDPRPDIDYRIDLCNAKIIPDNSFDLISCLAVLEHIPKFWKAAEEIQRILAADGILICTVPGVWPYHPTAGELNMGGDYWRFTHQGLEYLFDRLTKITSYYIPASGEGGEYISFGWGVGYVGIKKN